MLLPISLKLSIVQRLNRKALAFRLLHDRQCTRKFLDREVTIEETKIIHSTSCCVCRMKWIVIVRIK